VSLLKRKRLLLSVVGFAAFVAAGYLLFRWREDHGHHPAYGDIPTWLTFAAAVLGIPFALYQLRMQRRQLAEQQKTIADEFARQQKRDQLLDAQLEQTRAAHRVLIRSQADLVDLVFDTWEAPTEETTPVGDPAVGELFHMARVVNNSSRPIRDVSCRLKKHHTALSDPALKVGEFTSRVPFEGMEVFSPEPAETAALIRPGKEFGFVFGTTVSDAPNALMYVTFIDDAGTRWRIGHDLRLYQDSDSGAWS